MERKNSIEKLAFNYLGGQEISFDVNSSLESRLRLLCPANLLDHPYWQNVYSLFLPEEIEPEKFNELSVVRRPESYLSTSKKALHVALYNQHGFLSPKNLPTYSPETIPELHTGFTEDISALTIRLNEVPIIKLLGDKGQTDPLLNFIEERRRLKMTRLQHSQDLARSVAMTNLRLAINHPDLYLRRIKEDMTRYSDLSDSYLDQHHGFEFDVPDKIRQKIKPFIDDYFKTSEGEKMHPHEKQTFIRAIETAYHYGQYLIIGAYLHDVESLGWGDIVMKAYTTNESQTSINYSEDRALFEKARVLLTDSQFALSNIVTGFSLDENLLITMVKSLTSEGDPCLGGYLFKDKHKYHQIIRRLYPWLQAGVQAYDGDQGSGTRTNIAEIVSEYLPGGFVHLAAQPKERKITPIGSFEDRLRLLTFFIVKKMKKEDIIDYLQKLHIDPQRIFIAAEEFDIGPNVILKEIVIPDPNRPKEGYEEILPVPIDPGAVKRAILLFNILTLFYYNHEERFGIEKLIQDMITCCLTPDWQNNKLPVLNQKDFVNRTDTEVYAHLLDVAPLIPAVFNLFAGKMRIIDGEELTRLQNSITGNSRLIFRPVDLGKLINLKEGTRALRIPKGKGEADENTLSDHWMNITDKKYGTNEKSTTSVPKRLKDVNNFLQSRQFYACAEVDQDMKMQIIELINSRPESAYALRNALQLWFNNQVNEENINAILS